MHLASDEITRLSPNERLALIAQLWHSLEDERGTVVPVELDSTLGHEQRGVRPCIAVSDSDVNADQRFPLGRCRQQNSPPSTRGSNCSSD